MDNLVSSRRLEGSCVRGRDGVVGPLCEIWFDDAAWVVRYLVVNVRRWLPDRLVLVPPDRVREFRAEQGDVDVALTRNQIRSCPDSETDLPVVLQRLAQARPPTNWAVLLGGEALLGVPEAWVPPPIVSVNRGGRAFDAHLRTSRVVLGMVLETGGQAVGRIVDMLVDRTNWAIRSMVVGLIGEGRVLLPPEHVRDIVLETSSVTTGLSVEGVLALPPA